MCVCVWCNIFSFLFCSYHSFHNLPLFKLHTIYSSSSYATLSSVKQFLIIFIFFLLNWGNDSDFNVIYFSLRWCFNCSEYFLLTERNSPPTHDWTFIISTRVQRAPPAIAGEFKKRLRTAINLNQHHLILWIKKHKKNLDTLVLN